MRDRPTISRPPTAAKTRGTPASPRRSQRITWKTSAISRPPTAPPSWTRATAMAEQGNISRKPLSAHNAAILDGNGHRACGD
eukprot:13086416-Heterocapsa_arctica.AAC.1